MTTSQATSEAVKLLPKHTIICSEHYITTPFPDERIEEMECVITVYWGFPGDFSNPRPFKAPSFPACLDQIRAAIQQNETSKQ